MNQLSRNFDWDTYLKTVGVKDKIQTIQVHQLSYFKALDPVLNRTPLEVWKAYFKWNLISSFAPYLNKALVDESFAFYGKSLRDVAEQEVRWKRGVQTVNGVLGDGLGKIYVEKHFSA